MKTFPILEPVSQKFIEFDSKQKGLDRKKIKQHPQEDYFLISDQYPIFVVADGVTLELENSENYPNPSGAGDVARIFCEEIIKQGEMLSSDFHEGDLLTIFERANIKVGEYNKKHGRTEKTINFWNFDFFSATGAFAVIKNHRVYWASICDSYVAHFDRNGNIKFRSPECGQSLNKNLLDVLNKTGEAERGKILRKDYRNKVNKRGEVIGYGVITGENRAVQYLNHGTFPVGEDEIVVLSTDGFANYLKLPKFISLFKEWPDDLKENVQQFSSKKSKEEPDKYGHERTLIVIRL